VNNFIGRLKILLSRHQALSHCLAGAALIFFYFLPLFYSPLHSIPSTCADAWQAVWNAWWIKYWLSHPNQSLYFTNFLFHPHGVGLYLHTMYEGALLPLVFIMPSASPETIYSSACILLFFLNFICARLFFLELGLKPQYVFAFSILFIFNPFFVGHLNGGHLALLFFFPVLLVLTSFLRLQKNTLKAPFFVLSALTFGAAVYADMYFIYFTALFLPVLGAASLLFGTISIRKVLLWGALFSAIAAPIILTKAIPVHQAYESKEFSPNRKPSRYPTEPILYLFPGDNQFIWQAIPESLGLKKMTGKVPAGAGAYLGYGMLLLSILGLVKFKRDSFDSKLALSFSLTAFFFFLLATGPSIIVFSKSFPNPVFSVLFELLPHFPSVPLRFTIIGEIFLFGAAALGAKKIIQSEQSYRLPALCLVLSLIEFFPRPLLIGKLEPTAALLKLKADTTIKALIDADPHGKIPMFRQMFHEKELTEGYISRRPLVNFEHAKKNPLLRYIRNGQKVDKDLLYKTWQSFNVQAIIVENSNFEAYNRIASLPWLHKSIQDPVISVFKAD